MLAGLLGLVRLMKNLLLSLLALSVSSCAEVGESSAPTYVSEAPLPEGWPLPGPYDKVTEKKFPGYRAAFTGGGTSTLPFFTLFGHIKRNGIPMTAPVELAMEPKNGNLRQTSMAFLYQNSKVGKIGEDGKAVEVRDVPAFKALCYTWQGTDSKDAIAKAKAAIDVELAASKRAAKEFRMLGYNGPGTPREKRTWELQAVIE